jgi:uncharacterized membrane protein YdbT with pleckstrin-like domain
MPYQFNGQRSNEDIILMTRQHPSVLFKPMFQSVAILLIPALLYVIVDAGVVLSAVIIICLILALLRGFFAWFSWQNSLILLTDQRIIFLEQRGLLSREFAECGLESIQQVSHRVRGITNTVFGFGNIGITTGGSQGPFVLPNVPSPYDIQSEIQRAAAGEAYKEEEE